MSQEEHRERHLKALEPWMSRVAGLMGLSNWTILRSSERPQDTGAVASIEPIYGRYHAVLRIADRFLDRDPPPEQRDTIVHEMIHLHLSHLQHIAEVNLAEAVFPQFLLALEYAVDGMTKAWAEALPLPPEPRKKAKKG